MGHMLGLPLHSLLLGPENALSFAFTQFLLVLPIAIVNNKYFLVGFRSLFKRAPNMDSLIAIGSAAALVYGVFAIYRIGYGLGHMDLSLAEHYARICISSQRNNPDFNHPGQISGSQSQGKTSEAIKRLINLAPQTALVIRDNIESEIPWKKSGRGHSYC